MNAKFYFSATKIDLRDDPNHTEALIKTKEGEGLATKIGAKRFIECSALKNEGIKDAIEAPLRVIIEEFEAKNVKKHSCCCC